MGTLITHLPNTISALRMVLAPIFLYATALDIQLGVMIFIISALSDWLDGYIAKSLDLSSPLGALLDPLGDKAISWAALCVICQQYPLASIWIASTLIIIRDVIITTKRIRQYKANKFDTQFAVSALAKIKTVLLFSAQITLMLNIVNENVLVYITGSMLLYASSLLTLISFGHYLKRPEVAERKITRE